MANTKINAALLSKMFIAGAKKLEVSKEWINELNVFPVPDGDTGTNMTLTIMSAAGEVTALANADMKSVCKAISSGSLRGARGNSGVILSQLLRGFTNVIRDYEEVTIPILADAMEKAVETAYKAVMKPKEGTILTVARGGAEKGRALVNEGVSDMAYFIGEVIKHSDEVLLKTPDLLPVLKQAGVVDSGGQGLMEILKGAYDIFLGKELDLTISAKPSGLKPKLDVKADMEIEFGYCTELIIMLTKNFNIKHELDLKAFLESIGDSIVVVADGDLVKVHVHTNDPGLAIQRALKYGALSDIKIDNLRLEHQETLFKEAKKAEQPRKDVGFIAVSAGAGINEIFKSLGVDYLIEGGQTMNPSTEDMLNAINEVNADNIYIFPNNKNIILAANQAATLAKDKKVIVLPTTTVPQGITAIINFVPDLDIEENTANMSEELASVKTGQVTYAVRDTMIDDIAIKQGDFMGINDDGISSVGTDVKEVAYQMVASMANADNELISIYYGEDIKEEEAKALKESIQKEFAQHDIELQYGGQPIYYYIISVE
ncbi:MAG: DAK2 domain-containing protein [Lachnospiraceae bacterium]|nr:DAK2 domain-containing protein [Lachnospiraceae bacterium]